MLFVASKEIGLGVNDQKNISTLGSSRWTECTTKPQRKERKKSFETVVRLRYLEFAVTNKTRIHGNIKSRLRSENASYHSDKMFLPSCLL